MPPHLNSEQCFEIRFSVLRYRQYPSDLSVILLYHTHSPKYIGSKIFNLSVLLLHFKRNRFLQEYITILTILIHALRLVRFSNARLMICNTLLKDAAIFIP